MKKGIADAQGAQTKCVHAPREFNHTSAISPPIWQTTTFLAESSEHFAALAKSVRPSEYYSRYGNPTHKQVEAVMATLEGGEAALVTASGMGAICTSVMSLLDRGDHVVAQRNLYAGTAALLEDVLPRWGIECTFVDQTNAEQWAEALRPNTKLIYAETPANPLMRLTELQAVAALGKTRGITTIVDNTFATPINQRPLQYGIDVVVHSATKYLGGHSDVTAGVIIGSPAVIE
jgi:cystathionine gamma-lyase